MSLSLGVCEKLTGGTPNFKNHSSQVYLGRIFDLGVHKRVTILIWGYAKGIQFWFGGTQRGTIPIWGYVSTKRLRTPGLSFYNYYRVTIKFYKYNFTLKFFNSQTDSFWLWVEKLFAFSNRIRWEHRQVLIFVHFLVFCFHSVGRCRWLQYKLMFVLK